MAHVELSLSGAIVPQARPPAEAEFVSNVERWSLAVAQADEDCLVVDRTATILAVSATCSELLGFGDPVDAIGRALLGGLRLIDFTAGAGELSEPEAERIPPLLALTSERLARGLMRVQPDQDAAPLTVDAIATPLWENGTVTASLTFFFPVRY